MADDRVRDDEEEITEHVWMDTPRVARRVVYDHLEELICKFQKQESLFGLMRAVDGGEDAGRMSQRASNLAASAFADALIILQSHDPEFCSSCGEFHDKEVDHTKNMNPKDLS